MPSRVIVIPARMASTRFPGKPLIDLCGKPMVQWVYEKAMLSGAAERVLIATPDQEIFEAAEGFGAEAVFTKNDHPTGTDRIAEVALKVEADVYINVQGDEPLIDPNTIRTVSSPFQDHSVQMVSAWASLPGEAESNPAIVKVVTDLSGNALYFSRHGIPFPRTDRAQPLKGHIGIYGYRREVLLTYPSWSQTPLELAESLEQLRFMENGVRIRMVEVAPSGPGIDTPEQAAEVREMLLK
ncbi:MAG: 3-deoxy-manno-octulosonate cytidylyltransferase [Armatimonadota bacterium]